jgi:hypothetical protein
MLSKKIWVDEHHREVQLCVNNDQVVLQAYSDLTRLRKEINDAWSDVG